MPIVGVLLYGDPEPAFAAFLEKFRELGWEDGRNFRLEIRSADAQPPVPEACRLNWCG